jgi:TnpA family transposase
LREIGRMERTLFMLEWMQDPELRKRVQVGLIRIRNIDVIISALLQVSRDYLPISAIIRRISFSSDIVGI